MATTVAKQNTLNDQTLRTAMRANGVFSLISGLTSLVAAGPLSAWLGISPPVILTGLGIVLIIFAADLFWLTSRPTIPAIWGQIVVALDVLWVVGSAIILLAGVPELTTAGRWTVLIIADIVAIFAIAQSVGLWRMGKS